MPPLREAYATAMADGERARSCPILRGRAWALGLGVSAELLVPRERWGVADPGRYLLAAIDPTFPSRLGMEDVLVGGDGFGLGAEDDTPVRAILGCGLSAVIASGFDPAFERTALAHGLPALVVNEALAIHTGARLRVDLEAERVVNLSSGDRFPIRNLDDAALELYRAALGKSDA